METPDKISVLKLRSSLNRAIRSFFTEKHYLEVETPLLCPWLIPEPAIEVFKTEYINPYNKSQEAFLIPSPELWMKRLLAEGTGSLFQITKCFRNLESIGKQHSPEFSMLEWYTVDNSYLDSITVLEQLIHYLDIHLDYPGIRKIPVPIKRLEMKAAFKQILSLDLDLLMDKNRLLHQVRQLHLLCSEEDSWEELFNKIFLTFIEPELAGDRALILYDYPSQIPTTARDADNPSYSQRWEFYMNGIEIANCFSEETDPGKLTALLREEAVRKEQYSVIKHPPDLELPSWLHNNYPACSGVALGLDRLLMCLLEKNCIDDVLFFPFGELFKIR